MNLIPVNKSYPAVRANIRVRIKGNPNQRYALLFRDYLPHPNAVKTIERIKREIVKRHANDVETYSDIRDPVYDLIWDAVQGWAGCLCFSLGSGIVLWSGLALGKLYSAEVTIQKIIN